MKIRDKRKRAFCNWIFGCYITRFEERLLKRWWIRSGRSKLQATGRFEA